MTFKVLKLHQKNFARVMFTENGRNTIVEVDRYGEITTIGHDDNIEMTTNVKYMKQVLQIYETMMF